jgi:hypothetical protein
VPDISIDSARQQGYGLVLEMALPHACVRRALSLISSLVQMSVALAAAAAKE